VEHEVPADPAAPLVWTKLNTKQVLDMANPDVRGNWWGVAEELADFDYTDEVLSLPIPPVLLDDLKKWALHSEVPERKDVATEEEPEDTPKESSSEDGPDGPGTRPGAGRRWHARSGRVLLRRQSTRLGRPRSPRMPECR
jgi:hypothetical protein